jgi:putative zinc finger protein
MNSEPMSEHTDVGAYALGLLEPRDRQAFEEHLAGCPACAAELAELSGMKSLLSDLGPVEAPADEPPAASVTDLVRRRAESQRRHTRRQVLLGAAASVALLAGGVGVGLAVAGQPSSQVSQNAGRTVSAVDQQTGVHGKATLVAKPFGTQVTVDLAQIQGPLECQFIAVSRTGARFQIGTWFLPPHVKFGSRSHPEHLLLKGWTTIKPSDLSRIDVVAAGHGTQISIPV